MREIEEIILHCTASDLPFHDNIDVVRGWHVGERGWSDIGYHNLIVKSGEVLEGRPIEKVGSHCKNHNQKSIGICLTGNIVFSQRQFQGCAEKCLEYMDKYKLPIESIRPHNYYNRGKTCPNFPIEETVIPRIKKLKEERDKKDM